MVGDIVLLYVQPAFVNSYPGVCGRRRGRHACGRMGDRASLQFPLSLCHLAAPPPAPPRPLRRFTGTHVRSQNTGGRTGDIYTRPAALADRRALDCTRRRRSCAVICNKYIAVTYVKFPEISQYCRENKSENQSPENATIDALVATQLLSRGGGRRQLVRHSG